MLVLGAISGKSMDGVDVALFDSDGVGPGDAWAGRTYPSPDALRRDLLAARARAVLALSLPETTGCRAPTPGGEFFEAA
jgi:1,6-anhydro-N-acetylmuramate kinase